MYDAADSSWSGISVDLGFGTPVGVSAKNQNTKTFSIGDVVNKIKDTWNDCK